VDIIIYGLRYSLAMVERGKGRECKRKASWKRLFWVFEYSISHDVSVSTYTQNNRGIFVHTF